MVVVRSLPTTQQYHETTALQAGLALRVAFSHAGHEICPASANRDHGDWDGGMTHWWAPLVITRWLLFGGCKAGNKTSPVYYGGYMGKHLHMCFLFSPRWFTYVHILIHYEYTILLAIFTLIIRIWWLSWSWALFYFTIVNLMMNIRWLSSKTMYIIIQKH